MVSKTSVAVAFWLAACVAIACAAQDSDVALVLGDAGEAVESPLAVPADEGPVPGEADVAEPEPGPANELTDDMPAFGEVFAPWTAPVTSCSDEPQPWAPYTSVDALFIERINGVGPLAVENQAADVPGAPVITAGDMRYPVAPGVRIFQGWRGADCRGYEVGYLGIWGMHADAQAVSPTGSLALPGELGQVAGSGLDAATAIRPTLHSTLNSVELNTFVTRAYDGCRRHDPLPWRRVGIIPTADWILGVRWVGLDETATLPVTAATPAPRTTDYRVTTSSQLVGPQIGHRRRLDWQDWALEGWIKAAVVGSFLSQSQSAVVGPFDLVPIRGPQSARSDGVGMIGDVNATLVRRLGDHWGLRAGYTLLWFSGVAPAANQWDFSNTPTSGTGVATDTVFLHGATLGLEANW